ncbi:MAG: HAMP domain-containing histidine kinase [Gemmatimonadetes bacterium]|nr:HAMP domain-containing histidine kinase [Gemmatimonadota bacterium]
MTIRHRNGGRCRQSAFIAVLLLLTLGLAGLLAQQAHEAARSHRAVAEGTLRDYAAFAAWKFGGSIKGELFWMYSMALQPFLQTRHGHLPDEDRLPDPSEFVVSPEKKVYFPDHMVRSYFRLALGTRNLRTRGDEVRPRVRAWMVDTLTAHARSLYGLDWKMASLIGDVGGEPHVLVYVLERDGAGRPRSLAGFELDPAALAPVLGRLYGDGHYLPPSLVGEASTDSLLSLVVRDPAGRVVYRSPTQYPRVFTAADSAGTAVGGLTVEVSLRPEVARKLVIGGLPRSRVPLLLGLLALTAGLVLAALLQHRREYELAELRSEFVSNVSHELRTPLAQIRMFAETLLLGRVRSPDERRRSLEIIDQEARRLTHLVENVLHFSRAERRAVKLSVEPTDLSLLIREVVDGFLPLARARQIRVRTDLEEGLRVPVDTSAFRQMLLNLLDNAVKYGPAGQTITVGAETQGSDVLVRVDDEGPGIPPKDRGRIWERFWRLEREEEKAVAGTGIGLAVVLELARLHGGRAWVAGAPGGGARFVLELPGAEHTHALLGADTRPVAATSAP